MFYQFNNLKLDRKVAVLDLETTGTNYKTDRIVQFAVLTIEPGDIPRVFASHVDPGIPIPLTATAIHGIRDEDVKDSPDFAYVADELFNELEGAVLIGYNIKRFDLPLLIEEFARCGIEFSLKDRLIIDAYQIYREMHSRTLSGALEFYCGLKHEKAHQADEDVDATALVLDGQLARYGDLPRSLESLYERFATPDLLGKFQCVDNELHFTFGKHVGRSLREVGLIDPDYLHWMINEGDFLFDVREIVSKHLDEAMARWGAISADDA